MPILLPPQGLTDLTPQQQLVHKLIHPTLKNHTLTNYIWHVRLDDLYTLESGPLRNKNGVSCIAAIRFELEDTLVIQFNTYDNAWVCVVNLPLVPKFSQSCLNEAFNHFYKVMLNEKLHFVPETGAACP